MQAWLFGEVAFSRHWITSGGRWYRRRTWSKDDHTNTVNTGDENVEESGLCLANSNIVEDMGKGATSSVPEV